MKRYRGSKWWGAASLARELFEYARSRRKWWMTFLIAFLLTLGILMLVAEAPALSPFIYAIF